MFLISLHWPLRKGRSMNWCPKWGRTCSVDYWGLCNKVTQCSWGKFHDTAIANIQIPTWSWVNILLTVHWWPIVVREGSQDCLRDFLHFWECYTENHGIKLNTKFTSVFSKTSRIVTIILQTHTIPHLADETDNIGDDS